MSTSQPSSESSSSASSSSSSTSSSSSSSSRPHPHSHDQPPPTPHNPSSHPLLPPVSTPPNGQKAAPKLFAAEIDIYQHYLSKYEKKSKPAVPERCFTFCTQQAEGDPLCRMFCLRKQTNLHTQSEELKRLRPNMKNETGSNGQLTEQSRWSWNPFEALRTRLDPYSLIYVKGSPDGVVGRYWEEMVYDDGQCDFGSVSRAASDIARKRRGGNVWEWMSWDEHGSLLYLPLTSLFHPILSFPENLSKFLSPPKRLIEMYAESWTSGTQIRNLTALKEHVENGEPLKLLNRMGEYLEKNAKERKEEIEKLKVKREAEKRLREQEQERLKQQAAEVIQDRATGQREMVVDVVVDRDGSKRLVQRPYQMEELKKQDEQLKKMSDRFKKDENEVD